MQNTKTTDMENITAELSKYADSCDALSEAERIARLQEVGSLYNNSTHCITVIALLCLCIAGNTAGAEYFKQIVPLKERQDFFKSRETRLAEPGPVGDVLTNMFN